MATSPSLHWTQSGFLARGGLAGAGKGNGGPHAPPPHSSTVSLQLLGFFKGMSFPIASIAVVNSVLFGVYSNSLLVLTATSHQERRAQPPSYTHVFIAGCIGGFLQVRASWGRAHTHSVTISSFLPLLALSGDSQLQTRECGGTVGKWTAPAAPTDLPGLAVAFQMAGLKGRVMGIRGAQGRESSGSGWGAGDGAERAPL